MTQIFYTKLYQGPTLHQGIECAIKNRLYVIGWCMLPTLKTMKKCANHNDRLAIGFLDQTAVSIALVSDYYVQAFCRKQHRRKGYAGACVRALQCQQAWASTGIAGSYEFWQRMRVTV
jgi:hypothetical protein